MSSTTTTTTDSDVEASVSACGTFKREDIDMVGRMLKRLVDECRITVDETGIHISVVDTANVAMFHDLHIEPLSWDYDVGGEIGLDVEHGIVEPMKTLKSHGCDRVDVFFSDVDVEYVAEDKGGLAVDTKDPKSLRQEPMVPDLNYNVTERYPFEFVQFKDDMATFSDFPHMKFEREGNHLKLIADGDFETLEKTYTGFEPSDTYVTKMTTEYLHDITRSVLKSQAKNFDVMVSFDDEYPLCLDFQPRANNSRVTGSYIQAPRID